MKLLSAAAAVAAALVLGGPAVASAQPATAEQVGVASLHRTWNCVVPGGYVWSAVRSKPSCGSRYEYFLLDAVNVNLTGQWACAIPSGYSYTSSRQGINCSASPGSSAYEYRLVKV
ncbi:hypothetical protein LWC34_50150 [Kibdelosporangium philippinense]|uniref:Uncharacterized protein n=1 Tax=Kibdelosporangium philippinense TaxID=211113 RepID=A0ABS8ZV93_9PSEU|nr:hypothetical protein [Kibdelosporangium philippinense]MCE7010915.1 hypothetical protein [Kibdelosporangium philippinense]